MDTAKLDEYIHTQSSEIEYIIKWFFFDLGSTLIDETEADLNRNGKSFVFKESTGIL